MKRNEAMTKTDCSDYPLLLVNDGINHYGSRPDVRRSGSSSDDFEDETSHIIDSFIETLCVLFRGMTADFCTNGLPWEGIKCRSMMAGLSGALFALPAFVSSGHPYDQIMWSVQAFLSIMADYFHIHHDSVWHGIDRYFALFNLITTLLRTLGSLNAWTVLLAAIPVRCYVGANQAKEERDLESWHFWHFMWHLTAASLVCLIIYMLHECPNVDSTLELLCN